MKDSTYRSKYTTVRGFDIRAHHEGSEAPEKIHAWGVPGQLPAEWSAVKSDPSVERASIFYSTQRNRRADRRQYLDRYERGEAING